MSIIVQSVLISKNIGNSVKARSYLKKLGLKPIKRVHETKKYYRYRIEDPSYFSGFKTKKINNNIKIVLGIS